MDLRPAEPTELDAVAHLWWQGWRDAHLTLVPEALIALRTLDSFTDRMAAALPRVRVFGPVGAPLGFYFLKEDELYQFYLAAEARGTGAAAALMADAERHLLDLGIVTPWLACAMGNARAPRFYEKAGRWPASRTSRPRPRRARSRSRSGATRSGWPSSVLTTPDRRR